MKRFYKQILLLIFFMSSVIAGNAIDLKDIIGAVASKADSTDVSSIENIVGSVLGNQNVELKDIVGTWNYDGPAVSFKSDNLLKKAGGAAAATAVESKILPVYQRSGLTSLKLTVTNDSTFTMTVKKIKSEGKISKSEDGHYIFHFKALGKVNIGSMNAYITKTSTDHITLTFDASKLITIVEKIAKYSNNATIKTASALLNSYDGVTIGFKLKK